jgi:tetratricopeptide (TPR) repeat protein
MNRTLYASLVLLVLLCPGFTLAQSSQPKLSDNNNITNITVALDRQSGMYEDIEIMRRLLNGKLAGSASSGLRAKALVNNACTACHDSAAAKGAVLLDYDNDGWADLFVANGHGSGQLYRNLGNGRFQDVTNATGLTNLNTTDQLLIYKGFVDAHHADGDLSKYYAGLARAHVFAGAASLDTEGTYLKGHGIVYTLTLPPFERDPRPQVPKAPPKPLSDWERIRREIRQEKPPTDATDMQPKDPTLGDILLKLLADNGKHFFRLGPDESLTVAITFRAPPQGLAGIGPIPLGLDFGFPTSGDTFLRPTAGSEKPPTPLAPVNNADKQPQPAAGPSRASTWQDYVLLGDLHMKQKKAEEAIKAYEQALGMNPEPRNAATILQQLARAYLDAKKVDEARAAEAKAQRLFSSLMQLTTKEKPVETKPVPLPGKLIISATKKQLDDVGSGRMSFEDFRKAASVEFVTFSAEKK